MVITSPTPAGGTPAEPWRWLLCFAVKEEAAGLPASSPVVITGMGARNASRAISSTLEKGRPRGVITAGFAGGLNPRLRRGTVVHDSDNELGLGPRLTSLGAVEVRFHCASRIATTVADKTRLWNETGADAVEMESAVIRELCRKAGVPSATIRVISDAADEALPLDFNKVMNPADQIDWWKFARALALRPGAVGRLLTFQRQTRMAARELGRVLAALVKE